MRTEDARVGQRVRVERDGRLVNLTGAVCRRDGRTRLHCRNCVFPDGKPVSLCALVDRWVVCLACVEPIEREGQP